MIHEDLFLSANQDFTIFFTWENSKMCNITSQYFNIFNKKPPASCVMHMTKDFLICYSFSFYSSMLQGVISIYVHLPSCTFKSMLLQLCGKTMKLFHFSSTAARPQQENSQKYREKNEFRKTDFRNGANFNNFRGFLIQ